MSLPIVPLFEAKWISWNENQKSTQNSIVDLKKGPFMYSYNWGSNSFAL